MKLYLTFLLTLKATDEYSHLRAISVVRPVCATTHPLIFPIGQATKKPANRSVAGKGEGGNIALTSYFLLLPVSL